MGVSNRAPTPLELGCANPQRPCLIEGFIVSDPPLKQVVARSYEAGLRGERAIAGGKLDWKVAAFRIDSSDDILNVASQIQGRGVFQNVPATRRQGLEAGAQYQTPQYLVYANYAFVDATYQFTAGRYLLVCLVHDASGHTHAQLGMVHPAKGRCKKTNWCPAAGPGMPEGTWDWHSD
jgi:iron complex outermembrane receptor protein